MLLESLKEELIQSDDTFRRLYDEHQNYKRQLSDMRSGGLLSQEDETEIKRIKIAKLHLKDRMEAILRQHSRQPASV